MGGKEDLMMQLVGRGLLMLLKVIVWLVFAILRLALETALTDKEKAELFRFVTDDNNYNLELHMAVLKACGLKPDFDEVYEDYQKIYDKTMEMQGDKKNERGESGRGRAR